MSKPWAAQMLASLLGFNSGELRYFTWGVQAAGVSPNLVVQDLEGILVMGASYLVQASAGVANRFPSLAITDQAAATWLFRSGTAIVATQQVEVTFGWGLANSGVSANGAVTVPVAPVVVLGPVSVSPVLLNIDPGDVFGAGAIAYYAFR